MLDYWQHEHYMISGNKGTKSLIKKYQTESIDSYKSQDISIKLDLSWQTELTENALKNFDRISGNRNKVYEWNN